MDHLIQDFIQVLSKENEFLDKLYIFGEEKKEMIILGKVQDLDKLLQKEGIVVSNLEKTEKVRLKLQEQLAGIWGMAVEELTAAAIIKKGQESLPLFSDQVKQEIEHMQTTIQRLQEINRENNELIGASLEYIDNMQAMLMGDITATYSEKGTPAGDNPSRAAFRLLDKKA